MVAIVSVVIFTMTFFMIKYVTTSQAYFLGKYHRELPCDTLTSVYGEDRLQTVAADAFLVSIQPDFAGKVPAALSCFCLAQKALNPTDLMLEFTAATYKTSSGEEVATCSQIFADEYSAKFIGYGLSGFMFVMNMLLLSICSSLVKQLRLPTVSLQTQAITVVIFVALFVNTAVLLTLVDHNDVDFDSEWYRIVGLAMTMTLMVNAFAPVVNFLKDYSKLWLFRKWDRRGNQETSQTSIRNYINLYAGPEYALD